MNLFKFSNYNSDKRLAVYINGSPSFQKSNKRLQLKSENKKSKIFNQLLITQDISTKRSKYNDRRVKTACSYDEKFSYNILVRNDTSTPVSKILSNLTKKANSMIRQKLTYLTSYQKGFGINSHELECKSLSDDQFHQINQRILCFKYESKPIVKLVLKTVNELHLSSENLSHYSLEVKNKVLPIKVKFININREIKINLFT